MKSVASLKSIPMKTKATKPALSSPLRKDTKSYILELALKYASRVGIEGLTIGELAKAASMSKSGLFAHFGGKDQFAAECFANGNRTLC